MALNDGQRQETKPEDNATNIKQRRNQNQHYHQLVEHFDQLKRRDLQDLSSDQDLVFAIMNLISIEEHLAFTGTKVADPSYYLLITEVRQLRKQLMQQVVGEQCPGETWCIKKHLLAASYRLLEVGSKQTDLASSATDTTHDPHTASNRYLERAAFYYQQAYELYNLFWGLVMQILPTATLSADNDTPAVMSNMSTATTAIKSSTVPPASVAPATWKVKLKSTIQKLINCCIE